MSLMQRGLVYGPAYLVLLGDTAEEHDLDDEVSNTDRRQQVQDAALPQVHRRTQAKHPITNRNALVHHPAYQQVGVRFVSV